MNADKKTARVGGVALVLLGGAAFATSSPLARWARPTDPLLLAFGRLALAAVVLVLVDARHLGSSVGALSRGERLRVLGGGALLGAHFACYQWGLDHTSFAAAASLVSLEPVSVVAVAWALFGLRPTRREQVALGLATAGAFVVGSAAGSGDHTFVGDVGVLAAVLLFGLYLAVARAVPKTLPTRSYVALVYVGAAVTVGAMLMWMPRGAGAPPAAETGVRALVAVAGLALVPTLVGHTAVQAASRRAAPSVVALASPLETLGSIAIGLAFLEEVPKPREVLGASLILAGTLLALVERKAEVEAA